VTGHVLLCPIRKERKYKDLTETEAMELWISAKKIADNLKKYYNVSI
jgi:diadenosine tetraphosphate (Ap4A) HIT family hydrolase